MTNFLYLLILSIDSRFFWEVINIFLSTQSKKREVITFLDELKTLLSREDFSINTDIILIRKRKSGNNEKFSTAYTLLDLDYDVEDVVERLKELTVEEYSETKIDKDDLNPPLLYVFGKVINAKQVYVKLKIKGDQRKYILCVSFHYAKDDMSFPYE